VQKSTLLKVFFIIKKGIVSVGLGHWLSHLPELCRRLWPHQFLVVLGNHFWAVAGFLGRQANVLEWRKQIKWDEGPTPPASTTFCCRPRGSLITGPN